SLVIAGGVLLLASVVLNFKSIVQFFSGRTGKLGANTALLSIAVLTILVVLNFLGYRHHKRFDLTSEHLYTLSDQSKKILGGLQKDVKVIKFDKADDQNLSDTMNEFKYVTKHISYERIDPQQKPDLAQKYKVHDFGETVVISGDRNEKPQNTGEQDLINAILKVTRDKLKTICSVEGHGEKSLSGRDAHGLGLVEGGMKNENYQTKTVNLTTNEVPSECSVLILAGPKQPLFPQETAAIGKYLDEGGKVLAMIDPDTDPGLSDILKAWNISLGNNLVVDNSAIGRMLSSGGAAPLAVEYGDHPITKDMARAFTVFPLARPVKSGGSTGGDVTTTELMKTSSESTAGSAKGPISLGVAASKKLGEKEARLVVVGDSDFATNGYVRQGGNANLFLNTVNWLAQDEDLISIRPKSATNRSVNMTQSQQNTFFWLSVVFMPLAVIGSGAYIWWKRR
ncbi:MAG: GldG family protein, partial [Blastocatellia bacterium]|nr:GldG family protein [Blastocatellia bacterium]